MNEGPNGSSWKHSVGEKLNDVGTFVESASKGRLDRAMKSCVEGDVKAASCASSSSEANLTSPLEVIASSRSPDKGEAALEPSLLGLLLATVEETSPLYRFRRPFEPSCLKDSSSEPDSEGVRLLRSIWFLFKFACMLEGCRMQGL